MPQAECAFLGSEDTKFNEGNNTTYAIVLRKATKLLFVELGIVLVVGGVIVYALIIPTTNYHFHVLSMNAYQDGTADFSTDSTRMVRALGGLTLLTLAFGLLVGAAIGLTSINLSQTARTVGKATVEESMELLLKSGFVKSIPTEDGTKYEITNNGLRFLTDYQDLKRTSEQESTHGS